MRILVVDDDPVTRLTLERMLARRGCEVITAVDGEEAYEILQHEDAPKVAIVDWMMPFMSGPQLCQKLRASRDEHRTYVIMLTGKRGKEDLVTGLEAGADDYIRKPFDFDELYARVRAAHRLISSQEQFRLQASRDDLTGIPNRAAILKVLRRSLAKARHGDTPVSIILADVDRFKQVNDTYGHMVGDAVLRRTATLLQSHLRHEDLVGRYGGEEFLIVLPGSDAQRAFDVAERVRTYVESQSITTSVAKLSLTVSLGIATTTGDILQSEELISAADEALYEAKHAGRNRAVAR
jgi:two-component system, cell cycle response regulator